MFKPQLTDFSDMLRPAFALFFLVVIGACVGCGDGSRPQLGLVTGRVTIDGVPLKSALVVYKPEGVKHSSGMTDDDGYYDLTFIRDIKGVAVGTCQVTVRKTPASGASPELPKKYSSFGELTFTVKSGENQIDLELTSE